MRHLRHCLHRVAHEVEHDLPDLDTIDQQGCIRIKLKIDRNARVAGRDGGKFAGFDNRCAEGHKPALAVSVGQERPDLPDDLCSPSRLAVRSV